MSTSKNPKHNRTPQKAPNPEDRVGNLRCPMCGADCRVIVEAGKRVQHCYTCGRSFGLTAMG
jgi:transcription elongation factor Elf1